MPRVPDASSVTRLRALQSSAVADPTKRSASYIPATPTLLYSLRASDAGRGMFPGQTALSNPIMCGYVNPREEGFITRLAPSIPPLPRITMDLEEVDFDGANKQYQFGEALPPGADFEAVILGGAAAPFNIDQISYISIYDGSGDDPQLDTFGSVTITTTPAWPGSTFTSSATEPNLSADAGTYPGIETVITFRDVPVVANLIIQFYGNTPP